MENEQEDAPKRRRKKKRERPDSNRDARDMDPAPPPARRRPKAPPAWAVVLAAVGVFGAGVAIYFALDSGPTLGAVDVDPWGPTVTAAMCSSWGTRMGEVYVREVAYSEAGAATDNAAATLARQQANATRNKCMDVMLGKRLPRAVDKCFTEANTGTKFAVCFGLAEASAR
jgi:hypothetical protein